MGLVGSKSALVGHKTELTYCDGLFSPSESLKIRYFAPGDKMFPGAHLTRRLAKEAIETYLEQLAEEIAENEWGDIYGIGKMQVSIEGGSGTENLRDHRRLRTRMRLSKKLKKKCYERNACSPDEASDIIGGEK
jgi:nucleoid DNA-binding protein